MSSTSSEAAQTSRLVDWATALIRRASAGGLPDELLRPPRVADLSGIDDREFLARAAVSVGTAQCALVLARRRAGTRLISGRPLIELQAAGHRMARVAAQVALARASILAVCRDQDATVSTGSRAVACAAAAAEAAYAASHALVQIYGAAGTSDPEATAAFIACQTAAGSAGPPAELWLLAGRRRVEDIRP